LPIVQLINPRRRSTIYGLTAVDGRGRLADRTVTLTLGWRPGDRLRLTVTTELINLAADPNGPLAVSGQGRVHVPAAARHACRINPGDRVLLAAEPDAGVLLIHPLTTIDAMLAQFHDRAMAGAAA
jgi:bifunctional DNA-binding transcriptional regulator/antitoxin component of YhaV-PrlF toxin-antitoxin module